MQVFDLKTSPKLPTIWEINRYFQLTAGYNVSYNWNFDFRQDTVGRSAGFASRLTTGLTLRLKALTDPLFEEKPEKNVNENQPKEGNNRGRDLENRKRKLEEGGSPDTTKPGINEVTEKQDS